MRVEWRIPKGTQRHSEYVKLIPYPLKQLLHAGTSILRHTYLASFVSTLNKRANSVTLAVRARNIACEIWGYVARNGTTHSTALVAIRPSLRASLYQGVARKRKPVRDTPTYSSQREISSSHSGAPDESNLLECYAVLTSQKTLSPFRRRVAPPSSGSRTSIRRNNAESADHCLLGWAAHNCNFIQ